MDGTAAEILSVFYQFLATPALIILSAIWAAKSGARVTVLERMKEPGKKILMSGGTRCNLLPVRYSPDDYFSKSMKSVKVSQFSSFCVRNSEAQSF